MKKLSVLLILVIFLFPSFAFAKVGACPYKIIQDPDGVYIIEITASKAKNRVLPYYVKELKTNKCRGRQPAA